MYYLFTLRGAGACKVGVGGEPQKMVTADGVVPDSY